LVFPHDFYEKKSGVHTRFYELVKYFKARHFNVDMLSLRNFESSWKVRPSGPNALLNQLFFYDFRKGLLKHFSHMTIELLLNKALENFSVQAKISRIPDFAFPSMKRQFNRILANRSYDFVLISYVYWANLIDSTMPQNVKTVLTVEDFISLNLYQRSNGRATLERLIQEEIKRINLFHNVICISEEERCFFSKFADHPTFYYVPFFMKTPFVPPENEREFDILFIGFDNPHNRRGLQWFFDEVYSKFKNTPKILIVGNISEHVSANKDVTRIPYTHDLDAVYRASKMAICPLLTGTGLKVKVVESLSYGLPVVTTKKGVIGFPSKVNNGCLVTNNPEEFAGLIERLLSEKDFYYSHSNLAKRFFEDNFEESKAYDMLDRVFLNPS
jgi:glycosyltransferase involved in cell wall biosynthesis